MLAGVALAAVSGAGSADRAALANGPVVFSASPGEVPQLVTADLRSRRTKTITALARTETPVLSPGGRFVAFHQWVGDYPALQPQVGVLRADGRGRRRWIATGCDPAWSPAGKQIAFIHQTSSADHCVRAELAVVNRDGSALSGLYAGIVSKPGWSPDGRWIAFFRWSESASETGLYVIHPDGSDAHLLAAAGDAFSWAPDSRRIAVLTGDGLEVASVDGGGLRRLAGNAYRPRWSPNGRWIAYEEDRGPTRAIVVIDVDELTKTVVGDGLEPAWVGNNLLAFNTVTGIRVAAPDGTSSRLAIKAPVGAWFDGLRSLGGARGVSFRRYAYDYGANLYTMSSAKWAARRLTEARVFAVDPSVSPDGSRVAFTRVRPEGNHVIAIVGSNGRNLRTLTHNRYGWDHQPAWSPDGRRILFVRERSLLDGALYEVRARSGQPHLVWSGERPNHPAWAPNGRAIAIDGVPGRTSPTRGIRLVTSGRKGAVELTHPPDSSEDLAPSWSPDGTKLAFVRRLRSRYTYERAFVLTLATGEERPLTEYRPANSFLHPFAARWSPDGRKLVVLTCAELGFNSCQAAAVTTMAADGTGAVTRWQRPKLSALDVAWAPAPSRLR